MATTHDRTIRCAARSVLAATFVLATVAPAVAAPEDPTLRYILPESAALRGSPAGELLGVMQRNVKVKPGEKKGDWVKVTVEGWMRDVELGQRQAHNLSPAAVAPLEVVGFELRAVSKDQTGDVARVQLKIRLQNKTNAVVSGWSGTLMIADSFGNTLVRTPVEGGTDVIKPQSANEFNFYWKEGEDEYRLLSAYAKDSSQLKVSLAGVKVQ